VFEEGIEPVLERRELRGSLALRDLAEVDQIAGRGGD
jgi:hypothetical protein